MNHNMQAANLSKTELLMIHASKADLNESNSTITPLVGRKVHF
jgi:hypothetical protein